MKDFFTGRNLFLSCKKINKMNLSFKSISVFVSFLLVVCCVDQISADEKENATHRVECRLYQSGIECTDEKQNKLRHFNEIPRTTKVLILKNNTSFFDEIFFENDSNKTKLEADVDLHVQLKDFLQDLQNLESLTIGTDLLSEMDLANDALRLGKLKELSLTRYSSKDLPVNFFCSFPRMENLLIGYSLESDIPSLTCGQNNTCCSNLRRMRIESFVTYNTSHHIEMEAFRYLSNLQSLHLENMRIEFPPDLSFTDFPQLTNLKLQNSSLYFLSDNLSLPLQNLQSLYLLSSINTGMDFLIQLRVLGLINSKIGSVDYEFQNLAQLKVLDLSHNGITDIGTNSFRNCSNLALLDLSSNNISALTNTNGSRNVTNIFTSSALPNLIYLNLAHNQIINVDYSMIPETVKVLDISNNPLRSLSGNETSCGNHALKELHTNCALLRNIEHVCFPPSLEVISLKHSQISSLSAKSFSSLSSLKELLLDGNNLFKVLASDYSNRSPVTFILESECSSCNRFDKRIRNLTMVPVMTDQPYHMCEYVRTCGALRISELSKCDCVGIENEITISYCRSMMLKDLPLMLPKDTNQIYLDGNNLTIVDLDLILQSYSDLNVLYLNNSKIHQIIITDHVSTFLKEIHLEDNFIENLSKCFFTELGKISSLHLQRNSFKQFKILLNNSVSNETLFLDELHLENNTISEFVVENQFKFEYGMNTVYLQFNELSEINKSFCDYNISTLHFENNKITHLDFACSSVSRLKKLYLQNNYLSVFYKYTFYNMPHLHELNLEGNKIQQIKNKTFSHLHALRRLNLRRNKIEEMDEEMFDEVNNLEVLNLEENSLVKIPPLVFKHLQKLQTLYLNRNRITALSLDLFKNNEELKELHLEGNFIRRLDLSLFGHLRSLVSLNLNNNNISEINFHPNLDSLSLEELHLNGNQLKVLNREQLKRVKKIEKLFLHHNEIHQVDKDTFKDLTSLEILTLHENKLKQPEIWNFGLSPNIKNLTIHRNLFLCECEYLKDLRRFLTRNYFISIRSEIKCLSTENEEYSVDRLDDFLRKFCQNNKETVGLSVSIGLLLLIVFVSVLLYKYRLAIQVVFYSRFKVRFFYNQSMDEGKQFDAFVAYSYGDREFVANELAPRLEDYRLCLHDRHFTIGLFIEENIMNAINNSCCTLVIFSNSFVRSQWCRYEFRIAYEKTLSDRWRRLLVILTEDVNPDDLEDEMKLYLRTVTYVRWGDPLFWEKLYFALPSLRGNEQERNNRQQDLPLQQINRY